MCLCLRVSRVYVSNARVWCVCDVCDMCCVHMCVYESVWHDVYERVNVWCARDCVSACEYMWRECEWVWVAWYAWVWHVWREPFLSYTSLFLVLNHPHPLSHPHPQLHSLSQLHLYMPHIYISRKIFFYIKCTHNISQSQSHLLLLWRVRHVWVFRVTCVRTWFSQRMCHLENVASLPTVTAPYFILQMR